MTRLERTDVVVCKVPTHVDPTAREPRLQAAMVDLLERAARGWIASQWITEPDRPDGFAFSTTEWLITNNVEKLDEFQRADDCVACLAGNDQAKAFLRDHPGRWVAIANVVYTAVWHD